LFGIVRAKSKRFDQKRGNMFQFSDLPHNMHLTGSLGMHGICLATKPCHDTSARNGLAFGTDSV